MEKITKANVSREISELLESCPMTWQNLERLSLLYKVRKYIQCEKKSLTEAEAQEWCKHMDPSARWSMEQTTSFLQQKGYCHDPIEFYAVINSMVSDYGKTIAKYGMDKPDVWAELAHDWLDDKDSADGKTEIYYREIVDK